MYKGLRAKLGLKENVNTMRLAEVIDLKSLLKELIPFKDKEAILIFRYGDKIVQPDLIQCQFRKGVLSDVNTNHIKFIKSSPAFNLKAIYDFILTQNVPRTEHPPNYAYTFNDTYIGTITVLHNDPVSAYASLPEKLPNPHTLENIQEISNGMRFEKHHLSWDHLDEGD
jgi:hypothetical protein